MKQYLYNKPIIYLTKEELLFLLLRDYHRYRNNYLVPEMITLGGIKKELDCDLGFLSRLIKKNEIDGLIFRKKVKIINKKRRQNVYFLTPKGLELADRIYNMMFEPDYKTELSNEDKAITKSIILQQKVGFK